HYQATNVCVPGPAQRLGDRQVGRHRDRRADQRADLQRRQPGRHRRGGQRLGRADPDERRQQAGQQHVADAQRAVGGHRDHRTDEHHHRHHPTAPGGDPGAGQLVAGDLPGAGPDQPAAVQRQPGQQVEHRHRQVAPDQQEDDDPGDRAAGDDRQQAGRPGREHQADQRSGHRDQVFLGRVVGLLLDLRHAAEQEDHHPLDRQAEGQADRRVAELVGEQGDREQHREGEGHRVGPGGADAVDGPLDQLGVGDRDQQGDEHPGRRQIHRHAEEPAHREAGRLGPDRVLARPGRWLGHVTHGTGRPFAFAVPAGPRSLSWAVLTYRDPMTRPGPPPPRGRHAAPDDDARPDEGGPAGRHAAPDLPGRRHAAPDRDGYSDPPPRRRHAAPDELPNGVLYHRPSLGTSIRYQRPDPYASDLGANGHPGPRASGVTYGPEPDVEPGPRQTGYPDRTAGRPGPTGHPGPAAHPGPNGYAPEDLGRRRPEPRPNGVGPDPDRYRGRNGVGPGPDGYPGRNGVGPGPAGYAPGHPGRHRPEPTPNGMGARPDDDRYRPANGIGARPDDDGYGAADQIGARPDDDRDGPANRSGYGGERRPN